MTIETRAPDTRTDSCQRAASVTLRAENEQEQEWLARFADAAERQESYEDAIACFELAARKAAGSCR